MAEATQNRMTQTQIVKELAEATGVGNKVAKQFLEKYTEMAVRETKKKGMFVMPGIGRLVRVERKARLGRNPSTGESIKIPAKKVVKFRIAKSVKDSIVPPKAAKK
jgi:DNA-binding protein HU-beta